MKWFSITMVLAAAGLMQTHGIVYWSGYAGPWTGWLWSIALEGAALWLWANRDQERKAVVPLIASVLVLCAPLLHIIQPPLQGWFDGRYLQEKRVERVTELRAEITSLEQSLATALRNSESRLGWLTDIQETRNRLTEARSQLRAELEKKPATQGLWPWFGAVLQALALIVIWSVSVRAISAITAKPVIASNPKPSPAQPTAKAPSRVPPQTSTRSSPAQLHASKVALGEIADRVTAALDQVLERDGITQKEWAEKKGFTPKDVSLLRTYRQRLEEGKELLGAAKLKQMAATLGLIEVKETA